MVFENGVTEITLYDYTLETVRNVAEEIGLRKPEGGQVTHDQRGHLYELQFNTAEHGENVTGGNGDEAPILDNYSKEGARKKEENTLANRGGVSARKNQASEENGKPSERSGLNMGIENSLPLKRTHQLGRSGK